MAEFTTIARPYAEAVFELADKTQSLVNWSQLLASMSVATEHPQIRALLGNPRVPAAQLVDLIVGLFANHPPPELRGFVTALVENGRLAVLPQVSKLFDELKNQREGVVDADIQSAFPIDPTQLAGLVSDLERRFNRKVNPHVSINGELIGGVRVTIGDEVIDGSVKAKLGAMAQALKN